MPRFGFWETTRPCFAEEATLATLPTEQNAFLSASFAAARVLPTRLGTTQGRRTNFALTAASAFARSLQAWVPLQALDQPANLEPLAAFAFSVTAVNTADLEGGDGYDTFTLTGALTGTIGRTRA